MSRIFLVAGESSGDTHGANLIRALRGRDPKIECEGLGGPLMAEAGMTLHHDLASTAIMGFTEVVRSFPFIRRLFYETLDRIRDSPPDALVLIDYPGFNLRLAKRVHALGIPVVYYIGPQVWAWKKGRLSTIAACVDKMLVILPFEEPIYREAGVECAFVGHPLLDHVKRTTVRGTLDDGLIIGLMPGSRAQEIGRIFPVMLECAAALKKHFPEARFVVPCVDDARKAQVLALAQGGVPIETTVGEMYELLHAARFCMVASGTATVETALFGVPMVVLYRVSPITYLLARTLVNLSSIAMVNILSDKAFVPEFIQGAAQAEQIVPVALKLIEDTHERETMIAGLDAVRAGLDAVRLESGGASAAAAGEIIDLIERRHG